MSFSTCSWDTCPQVGFTNYKHSNYCCAHCVTSDTSPLTAVFTIPALLWSVSGSRRRFCPGSLFAELLRRIRSSEALIAIVTGNNYPRCSRCGVWPGGQCVAIRLYPLPPPPLAHHCNILHSTQTKTLVWLYCDPTDFKLQHTNTFQLTQLRTDWSCQLSNSCQVLPNVQLLASLQSVVRAPSHYCSKIAQGPCPLLVYCVVTRNTLLAKLFRSSLE